jgi:mRNA interferase MazF
MSAEPKWSRGDVVICVFPKEYGKPRPAVVVQSDLFNTTHASIVTCPVSSETTGLDLFRIPIQPSESNGLRKPSEVMVDKLAAIDVRRVRNMVGQLSATEMKLVDQALRLWLDLPAT